MSFKIKQTRDICIFNLIQCKGKSKTSLFFCSKIDVVVVLVFLSIAIVIFFMSLKWIHEEDERIVEIILYNTI